MLKLYQLVNGMADCTVDDPRVVEVADILERLIIRADAAGETGAGLFEDQNFVKLLDANALESNPVAQRIAALLHERGWTGWTQVERVPGR